MMEERLITLEAKIREIMILLAPQIAEAKKKLEAEKKPPPNDLVGKSWLPLNKETANAPPKD